MPDGCQLSITLCAILLLFSAATEADPDPESRIISYRSEPGGGAVFDGVIDTRPADLCRKASLSGARCLAPEQVLGPHRRLPNFSGLLWLLGSAGLSGEERVLVVGDSANRRDFIAGLLYLAGQQQIAVLDTRISGSTEISAAPGLVLSNIREKVFVAPMRSGRVVLRNELQALLASGNPPPLLDGRSEREYWGERVRGARGGHLPGAQHFASTAVNSAANVGIAFSSPAGDPIAYGHDGYEGLVYLARLVANGIASRVYLEGWSGWASDGALPVDSVSYPEPDDQAGAPTRVSGSQNIAVLLATAGGFAFAGFILGRLTHNRGAG